MYDENDLKSDLIFWIIASILSLVFIYFFKGFAIGRFKPPFIYIWYAILLIVLYFSFLEAKDGDAIITGKTQSMGINNSFTGASCLFICLSPWSRVAIVHYFIITTLLFTVRYFGRKSRGKLKELVGKEGVMISNLHNSGSAKIDNKEYKVYSKEDLFYGSKIKVEEIKASYIYVKKI
ncbi:NfeD family protein [Peptostreptococcus equinus]|uniref:NfeD-like C-terminal domain-containing protein n=1 Tax=Peptostreptococcus equinus TaxID=3003601 RepID=A0ABY7JST4_9FIRM|nr:NfeD family protein [Peptostreptococcus sp. CBA3647]WAW15123.1 hypothetical protein O0R46_01360 [Peptostreptococcus sp. CBA3647]